MFAGHAQLRARHREGVRRDRMTEHEPAESQMACRAGPRGTHHREATLPGGAVAQEGERRRGGKNGGGIGEENGRDAGV